MYLWGNIKLAQRAAKFVNTCIPFIEMSEIHKVYQAMVYKLK